jgi:2,4-dichlorophenol 6-monooxygenase
LDLPFLKSVVVGTQDYQDPYCDWQRQREIEEAGALLVRPDGYIAWRQRADVFDQATASKLLREALETVLGKV